MQSDDEEDVAVNVQPQVDSANVRQLLNTLRNYSRDPIYTDWLDIPSEFMHPPLMCTSTEFARITTDNVTTTGPVLMLFAHGGTSMPEHFQKMLQCVGIINRNVRNLSGYAFETPRNKLISYKKGKQTFVTGVTIQLNQTQIPATYEQNFIETVEPILCADAMAVNQMVGNEVDVRQELCTVEWGLIPYRYVAMDLGEVRDIFQIMRVIPCTGFDLVSYVQSYASASQKSTRQVDKEFEEMVKLLQQVLDVEMANLGMSSFAFPAPLTSENPLCPTSLVSLLSPCLLLRKMLRHFPGGFSGPQRVSPGLQQNSLRVYGIPEINTRETASETIDLYDRMHRTYIELVQSWIAGVKVLNEDVLSMQEMLFSDDGEFIPCKCAINMVFYASIKDQKDLLTRRIAFPLLVSTLLTNFKFVNQGSSERWRRVRDGYIMAQCGSDQTELTPVRLHQFYRSSKNVNYPEAGIYLGMRKAMESLLTKENVLDDVDTYMQYILYCQTILNEQQIDGFFMSERVRYGAELLRRAKPDMNEGVMRAMRYFGHGLSRRENQILQHVLHDDCMHTMFLIQRGLCFMNRSIKATTINLGLVFAAIVSDVLTFLGMDNNSWTWCFFPMLICGGGGHLRAQTEDGHSQKTECVYLAKASSVGFNAVVVSTMNAVLTLVSYVFPDLRPEVLNLLALLKMDRATRVAIEEGSAVQTMNGQVFQVPDPSIFMRVSMFDELARNASEDAINGLITSGFPRDKCGGGTTHKSTESKNRGPRELQETKILRGMGFYSILQAQNRNCSNAIVAESYKALVAGAVACFVPSAQPSPGFPSLDESRCRKKHRCNIHDSSNAAGESHMPSSLDECKHLAWVFSILPMNCRSIGLLNKMGMTKVVVNEVEEQLSRWFGAVVQNFFKGMVGSMLTLSFARVMNGYLSRGVASSLIVSNALSMSQNENFETANFDTIMHMETGIGLHAVNNALLDGLTHLLDFNMVIVNKIVAHKFDTPHMPMDFLKALFNDSRDLQIKFPGECVRLCAWMQRFFRTGENRLQHGYVLVPALGERTDYQFYEQYLEVYCSVVPGSFFTYQKAINECMRTIDLSDFFSLDMSMLKCSFSRCGFDSSEAVHSDSEVKNVQQTFVHVVRRDKAERYYVHLAQHLLLVSLMGESPLHSDNVYSWGKRVFQLILNEVGVQQQVPNGLLCHSFDYEYGQVVPSLIECRPRHYYMLRSRRDISGWMHGKSEELNGSLGAHPIEDIMHVGSWIHYATSLDCCAEWGAQPFPILRPLELVPGRVYAMQSLEFGNATLCICPGGKNYVLLVERGGQRILNFTEWTMYTVFERKYQVAPLVFRPNAVVNVEGRLGVLVPWTDAFPDPHDLNDLQREVIREVEDFNYMDYEGRYCVYFSSSNVVHTHWSVVHSTLLQLGTWIYVCKKDEMKVPDASVDVVKGWLRYPDESQEDANMLSVYVAFRVSSTADGFDGSLILPFALDECSLASTGSNFCDYLLP